MDAALGAERCFPAELEDFDHEPRLPEPGTALTYAISLYGVRLGRIVYKAGALAGWNFYPSAVIAERANERVAVGAYSLACPGTASWCLDEPAQIGGALNDAARLCLARLLEPLSYDDRPR